MQFRNFALVVAVRPSDSRGRASTTLLLRPSFYGVFKKLIVYLFPADNPEVADHRQRVSMTPAHPFALFGRRAALLVLILTFLALGLRLYRLSNQSFWVDEVYTVFTATVPFVQVDSYSTEVSNSLPTYFLILGLFLPAGNSDIEWAARLLSALAGALSVPVFIGVVYCWRRHTRTALLAGLLLAVNPLHI